MRRAPMARFAAILEIPLERAEDAILDVEAGPPGPGRVWLLGESSGAVTGGPERFTVAQDHYRLTVEVDRARRTIATQGGWWYRGEYTLDREGPRTRLTHRIYNVASAASRWAVPLANRFFIGFEDQSRRAFADTVRDVGERLGCEVRVLDTVAA